MAQHLKQQQRDDIRHTWNEVKAAQWIPSTGQGRAQGHTAVQRASQQDTLGHT